ncbi:putative renin receptor [Plasmopara halstedii]
MLSLFLLSVATLAVFDTRSTYPFSTAGMANLALDSLGLRSGRISSHPAVPSPVQADIFTNSQVMRSFYWMKHLRPRRDTQVKAEVVQEVLKANSFLSSNDEHDLAFTRELAQLKQLTTNFVQMEGNKLLLVGLTGLQGDKEKAAHEAISNAVLEFLAEMMKFEHVAAAQIMTGSLPTGVEQIAALSRRTRNRKLATKQTTDEETEDAESGNDSEGSDGDDNEEEEIAAASGSMLDDGSNSTSTINSTSQGALLMSDIAEYQIILWTSVLLGATLLMAIMAMVNMNAGRDSLLYANFIADVNGRKTN